MVYTDKEEMHSCLNNMLGVIQNRIAKDFAQGKNIDLCLAAYNYWQDEERDGVNYIFNLEDENDLKYLVDKGMITASDICWVMKQKSHLFMFEGEVGSGRIKVVYPQALVNILMGNSVDFMACAIMYVGRTGSDSPYANVYDEYVTSYIEDFFD